jgi:hypothetical protein
MSSDELAELRRELFSLKAQLKSGETPENIAPGSFLAQLLAPATVEEPVAPEDLHELEMARDNLSVRSTRSSKNRLEKDGVGKGNLSSVSTPPSPYQRLHRYTYSTLRDSGPLASRGLQHGDRSGDDSYLNDREKIDGEMSAAASVYSATHSVESSRRATASVTLSRGGISAARSPDKLQQQHNAAGKLSWQAAHEAPFRANTLMSSPTALKSSPPETGRVPDLSVQPWWRVYEKRSLGQYKKSSHSVSNSKNFSSSLDQSEEQGTLTGEAVTVPTSQEIESFYDNLRALYDKMAVV